MTYKIKFGTDGWRAFLAKDYTFENLQRCAQGFANYMNSLGKTGETLVVGHDCRFLAEEFAQTVASVLAANGFKILLTSDPTPTPVISFAIVDSKAAGGVNITASHNPPADNGFKVRDATGGAIAPEGLQLIEDLIPDTASKVITTPYQKAVEAGQIEVFDASINYIEHIKSLIDLQPIKDAGLKVLVDPMWGNGACLLYTSPSPRDRTRSRMPSSA